MKILCNLVFLINYVALYNLAGACWEFIDNRLDEGKSQFDRTNKSLQLPPDCVNNI